MQKPARRGIIQTGNNPPQIVIRQAVQISGGQGISDEVGLRCVRGQLDEDATPISCSMLKERIAWASFMLNKLLKQIWPCTN